MKGNKEEKIREMPEKRSPNSFRKLPFFKKTQWNN